MDVDRQAEFDLSAHWSSLRDFIITRGDLLLPRPDSYPVQLNAELRAMLLGRSGKLVRPVLSAALATELGANIQSCAVYGWAVELIHCSSLVLDDLPSMDASMHRRGELVVHLRHSEAFAILLAAHMHNVAMQLVAAHSRTAELHQRFSIHAYEAMGGVGLIGGQYLDLALQHNATELHEHAQYMAKSGFSDLWSMCANFKTASLFRLAVYAGILDSALADHEKLILAQCGESVGLVFQLRDDEQDGDGILADGASFGTSLTANQRQEEIDRRRAEWYQRLEHSFGKSGTRLAQYFDCAAGITQARP